MAKKDDAAKLNIKPLDDRLVVESLEAEETTAGGILLPDTAKQKPQRGCEVVLSQFLTGRPLVVIEVAKIQRVGAAISISSCRRLPGCARSSITVHSLTSNCRPS